MNLFNRKSISVVLLSTSVIISTGFSGVAFSEEKSPWSVKAYGVFGAAEESFSADRTDGSRVETDGDGILGAGVAVEYRLNELIGLEVGGSYSVVPDIDEDADNVTTDVGEGPDYIPFHLAVNFHLLNRDKLDLYAGPRIAYVGFSDFDVDLDGQSVDYEVDNEFGIGAAAGISYQIGNSPVALTAEISYLAVEMNVQETGTPNEEILDFNPVVSNLGITYQF